MGEVPPLVILVLKVTLAPEQTEVEGTEIVMVGVTGAVVVTVTLLDVALAGDGHCALEVITHSNTSPLLTPEAV